MIKYCHCCYNLKNKHNSKPTYVGDEYYSSCMLCAWVSFDKIDWGILE